MSDTSSGNLIFIDPASGFEIRPISPSEREFVGSVISGSSTESREAAMHETLASLPDAQVFGGFRDGIMVAAYALRKDGLANDLAFIVVLPGERRHGIGRTMLQDALRRSGRRPLAAQTPEDMLPFFKACGFKLVGRRVQPDGEVHFRVGWHTPGAKFKGGTTSALQHTPIDSDPST
jgi:GNAT superfamily N-acetyltransferase